MKICIIGAVGHIPEAYAGMKLCPEAEFVGIAPGSPYDATDNFDRYDAPVYDDYIRMLEETKPDVAVINPVYGFVGTVIQECARRGIDVFAEKPVAGTLEELEQVRRAVKESGIHFSAMHFLRFTPSFYHARKMVAAGAVGQVRMITAQKSYRFGTRPDWYADRSLYTGTIPWIGIHAIDWISFFSGKKFKTVKALQIGRPERAALCQFELEDDVIAAANIDFLRPASAPTHGDDRVRVAGTEGVVEVFEDHFVLMNGDGVQEFRPDSAPNLACDFLMKREELTPDEIFQLTKVALLARESADTNKILEIG